MRVPDGVLVASRDRRTTPAATSCPGKTPESHSTPAPHAQAAWTGPAQPIPTAPDSRIKIDRDRLLVPVMAWAWGAGVGR